MLNMSRASGLRWFCLIGLLSFPFEGFAEPSVPAVGGSRSRIGNSTSRNELRFEENRGQTDEKVHFFVRGLNYRLFLTGEGAVFSVDGGNDGAEAVVHFQLFGANQRARYEGLTMLNGRSHYLRGKDLVHPILTVPSYGKVRYQHVYPGIDLVYYGSRGRLEYDFVVAPGADPNAIQLGFLGAEDIRVDETGDLVVMVGHAEMRQRRPLVYQESPLGRQEIESHFALDEDHKVGFTLGPYDKGQPLYIDPVLDYSSFLGAGDEEAGNAVAVDSEGNLYVIGSTESADFPVSANSFQPMFGGDDSDVFISKFAPDGETLLFSTYIGSESNDVGLGIALDSDHNVYATGYTESEFFPVNGFQTAFAGVQDCFIIKLSPDGTNAPFSTYLGHGDEDRCTDIAVDSTGSAIVSGFTRSLDFPTTDSAFQTVHGGGRDGFVARLNSAGTDLLYSTFLGGTGDDLINGVAIDEEGVAYVTGDTKSSNFPLTSDARQSIRRGEAQDGFLTKISSDGAMLAYSSLIGGTADDAGNAIALDSWGNIYIAGTTDSADFPVSDSPFQNFFAGKGDAFLTVFDPTGREEVYSAFLGGTERDSATDVAVDAAGNAVLVGVTESEDFPITTNAVLPEFRGEDDAFVVTFNSTGTGLLHSSFFGGKNDDQANAVALNASGDIYFAGFTRSDNFPVTDEAFQRTFNGGGLLDTPTEAFAVKLRRDESDAPLVSVSSATFRGTGIAPGSIVASFGAGLAPEDEAATQTPLPTALAGVTVRIIDSAGQQLQAPLFFVSPGQINFFLPEEAATGRATVVIERNGSSVAAGNIMIQNAAPGLYSANASGEGVAAAFVTTLSADGSRKSQPVFSGSVADGFDPRPIDLGAETDQVVLELFGTGIRGGGEVEVTIAGAAAEVLFAGPQEQFLGLDQVNVSLDRALIGRGPVPVVITADGQSSNTVMINIQ